MAVTRLNRSKLRDILSVEYGRMKSYRDLEVYQESKRLAIEIHKISLALPKFEMYDEEVELDVHRKR